MRTQGSAQELENRRMIAARMFERDVAPAVVANDLDVKPQTVRHWRRLWRKQGTSGLRSKPHPGKSPRLDDEQKQQLLTMLARDPTAYEFTRHFWTTAMIRDLILKTFNVRYNSDWVGEMLHDLGWSYQKPMRRSRERDEARIGTWRSNDWPEIQKKTPPKTG